MKTTRLFTGLFLVAFAGFGVMVVRGQAPRPAPRTVADAPPQMLRAPQPRPGSPNVVVILMDDMGYADAGAYGAEIATPSIDRLAASGLTYTNFHARAICSPTRASLLTGRDNHAVGMKDLATADTGYDNGRGRISPSAATVAQVLQENGYATYAVGKWHLVPTSDMATGGPKQHWPLQKGFDRFYGFLSGWTDQFHPALIIDNHVSVTPDRPNYHLSEDMVDTAIRYVDEGHSGNPGRPFFLYLAFNAPHAPIQAPDSYIRKYVNAYDEGWDALRTKRLERQKARGIVPADVQLPPRNPGDPAWTDLPADTRTVYARHMAAYAAYIEHADAQIGRLVEYLKSAGLYDNTLLVFMSDNGAAPEAGIEGAFTSPYGGRLSIEDSLKRLDDIGTERSQPLYQRPWAMLGVTPFRMYKLSLLEGGLRVPLIVSWPTSIATAGVRRQFIDVTDIAPTVLDLAGLSMPTTFKGVPQLPLHGASIAPTFADATAADPHPTQAYELRGGRAIYDRGWKAVATHVPGTSWDADTWALYDLTTDLTETRDLSARHPEKLKALQELWWAQAEQQGLLPLSEFRLPAALTPRTPAPR